MDNRREEQEVLMTIQNLGKLGAFMDPFFKLTAVGTILLIQHFYRMYREGKLSRKFQYRKRASEKCTGIEKKWSATKSGRTGDPVYGIA